MFGVGTKDTRLHVNQLFVNLLGEDSNSWGLSHKGLLWHGGHGLHFTRRFVENQATRIGLLFDGINGTLTYFKDGECLGIAFRGLNDVRIWQTLNTNVKSLINNLRFVLIPPFQIKEPIYPIITSTAAKTEMVLTETRRDFVNLQDRCRAVLMKYIKSPEQLDELQLPKGIVNYISSALYSYSTIAFPPVQNYDTYMV